MRSGYKLLWSDQALKDLEGIISYLEETWGRKEIKNFAIKLDKRIDLIQAYPKLFPKSRHKTNVRRSVLTHQTVIYYKIGKLNITIVTLFDTRRSPSDLKS